jgi:hypothetical protein
MGRAFQEVTSDPTRIVLLEDDLIPLAEYALTCANDAQLRAIAERALTLLKPEPIKCEARIDAYRGHENWQILCILPAPDSDGFHEDHHAFETSGYLGLCRFRRPNENYQCGKPVSDIVHSKGHMPDPSFWH